MADDQVINIAEKRDGFTVDDAGAEGFHVEIKVFWVKSRPPETDTVLNSLTNVYGKAFDEVVKRLSE